MVNSCVAKCTKSIDKARHATYVDPWIYPLYWHITFHVAIIRIASFTPRHVDQVCDDVATEKTCLYLKTRRMIGEDLRIQCKFGIRQCIGSASTSKRCTVV